ncbi:MAG: hypothetical protein R6X19_07275 [Kiritimatiellia bacterium]
MNKRITFQLAGLLACLLLLAGCVSSNTFVKSVEPNWNTITLRSGLSYDQAWDTTVDFLVKRFDMELLSRTDGYLRTHWSYTWKGEFTQKYRIRIALKFSPDRKTLEIKTEAESGGEGKRVAGYDTRLRDFIRTELAALIGTPAITGASK